jgi:hypothetical protein
MPCSAMKRPISDVATCSVGHCWGGADGNHICGHEVLAETVQPTKVLIEFASIFFAAIYKFGKELVPIQICCLKA